MRNVKKNLKRSVLSSKQVTKKQNTLVIKMFTIVFYDLVREEFLRYGSFSQKRLFEYWLWKIPDYLSCEDRGKSCKPSKRLTWDVYYIDFNGKLSTTWPQAVGRLVKRFKQISEKAHISV